MVVELITLPLRVSLRTAQLLLRGAEEVTGRALEVADRVAGAAGVAPGRSTPHSTERPRTETAPPVAPKREATREREVQPEPPAPPAPTSTSEPSAAYEPPLTEEPDHVSEEATLVREEAEAGAEDGAGAEVHVAEPWREYDRMHADEVIGRLAGASSAELAAVALYEDTHRRRATVMQAVTRELRRVNNQR